MAAACGGWCIQCVLRVSPDSVNSAQRKRSLPFFGCLSHAWRPRPPTSWEPQPLFVQSLEQDGSCTRLAGLGSGSKVCSVKRRERSEQ